MPDLILTPDQLATISAFVASTEDPTALTTRDGQEIPEALKPVLKALFDTVTDNHGFTINSLPTTITPIAAASLLDVPRPTVMRFIRDGKLHAEEVNGCHRIPTEDVLALLEERKREQSEAIFALMDAEEGFT